MKRSITILSFLFLAFACRTSNFKSSEESLTTSSKKKVCLSFQGNGVYFASHLGALISLLENNYEPVFAVGGSSGAIIASVARAVVENPSLRGSDGTFDPQKAAILLASSSSIIESFLFLPRFTTPFKLIGSLDVFLSGSAVGVLNASPKDAMVHAESVIGQSTMIVNFYRSIDFKSVLSGKTLAQREQTVASLWQEFSGAIRVTTDEFADAVFTPRNILLAEGHNHLVQIQDRFFKLYISKQDTMLSNFRSAQEDWNQILGSNFQLLGFNKPEKRHALVKNLLNAVRSIESFDSLAATLSGDFMLADPDRVYRAFQGFDARTGQLIEIPSNVVIHSTARRAVQNGKEWKEQIGLESLYQVYFSNSKDAVRNAGILLKKENNPFQPSDLSKLPAIPSERLAATAAGLAPALMASTGEASAFVRFPVAVDSATRNRFSWYSDKEQLIGFGGWLEKVAVGTAVKFNECSAGNVDLYFHASDGAGINRFSKMVFTGLFSDAPMSGFIAQQIEKPTVNPNSLFSGKSREGQQFQLSADQTKAFEQVLSSMQSVLEEASNKKARLGNLPVSFNYSEPSMLGGHSSKELDLIYHSNRRAMILEVYEYTRNQMAQRGLGSVSLPLWNSRLESILDKKTPFDILSVVSKLLPRPALPE